MQDRKLKHIEVEGCIVNIRTGLHDMKGRRVTSIEIIPDDSYCGERIWRVSPRVRNVRVIETSKVK